MKQSFLALGLTVFSALTPQLSIHALSAPEVLQQHATTKQTYEIRDEVTAWLQTFYREKEEELQFCEGISTPALAELALWIRSVKNKQDELPTAEKLAEESFSVDHPIIVNFSSSMNVWSNRTPKLHQLFIDVCQELGAPLTTHEDGSITSDIRFQVSLDPSYYSAEASQPLTSRTTTLTFGLPLLNRLSDQEIRCVLAHELTHFMHGHHGKRKIMLAAYGAGALTALSCLAKLVHSSMGNKTISPYIRYTPLVIMAAMIAQIPLETALYRSQEYEADEPAVAVGGKEITIGLLRKTNVNQFGVSTDYDPQDFATVEAMIDTEFSVGSEEHGIFKKGFEQIKATLIEQNTPSKRILRWIKSVLASHPSTEERIRHVEASKGTQHE